ncbi:MAG: murein hydrolase activator EnvC family protein [Pseudobdellovibrionaceae bacterium]
MTLRIGSSFLILIFVFSFGQAWANTPNDMDKIATDLAKTKRKLEFEDQKQRQILSALFELNKKIKKIVTNKGALSEQNAFLEMSIQNLNTKVNDLDQGAKAQRTLLAERLRAIYKLGGVSLTRFLFSSKSSISLERNLKILGIVATRDLELIKNYSRDLKVLQDQRKNLALKLESIKIVEQKIVAEENKLRQEQELKVKILDGIRKSRLFTLNKLNGLKEKSLQFNIEETGLFDLLYKPSFAEQKGNLPSPLQGIVTQKFGLIRNNEHLYTMPSKGIFISAAKGSPIKSVFEGRVSYVGELSGFGTTLIVDHGDHYYSVYSHAQEVQVSIGDEIAKSQVIANVGEAPQESNPGLYFEIRHFSEPYDPQQWMKGL